MVQLSNRRCGTAEMRLRRLDLSKREHREQWEQEEGKCMAGPDTGNVSLDQSFREPYLGVLFLLL